MAQCQKYTFDGVFHSKLSSMLFHLYIAWALVYGWMSGLILLHKSFLGHFMQEITKKRVLFDLLLENSFFFSGIQN